MLPEFIVLFRETIEVAFVVGIMLAYLHKTKNEEHEKHVYLGVSTALVVSIILAFLFQFVQGGFEANEELFEGVFMIVAAILVTWLVLWMAAQKKFVENLKQSMKVALDKKETFSLFLIAFVSTLREGVETVLFTAGIFLSTGTLSIVGALLGAVAAVVVGILVFEYAMKFNAKLFFNVTTFLLILLAAGLVSHGVHELQEAKVLPIYIEHIYDINPPVNPDGTYPLLHEKGVIGGVLRGLFGYDGNPSLLTALSWSAYLVIIFSYLRIKQKD
ncbi:MAG TPA: FTR1 family protein [Candidatus Bilamarchaeaceae archaeon]|nr:FTR1 family protein [Candidatus Bilamarchaeaceae archaeon]